jgi:hypothetical protein
MCKILEWLDIRLRLYVYEYVRYTHAHIKVPSQYGICQAKYSTETSATPGFMDWGGLQDPQKYNYYRQYRALS